MKINVTQQHIMEGSRNSPWKCPIALAIKDQGGVPNFNGVGATCVWVAKDGHDYDTRIALPMEAEMFIGDFDRGTRVEPFSFELDLTKEVGE